MNAPHLHLLLNHAPVFGILLALVVLAVARVRRRDELARLGLWVLVGSALAAATAIVTGEPAEHAVEQLAGISEPALEAHEEAAELAALSTYIVAVIALAGLALRRLAVARQLTLLALVGAVGAFALMARTANLGGRIRHPEILAPEQAETSEASANGEPLAVAVLGGRDDGAQYGRRAAEQMESLIPGSVRAEHEEIQAELRRATRAEGPVGVSARALHRVLQPHFEREEQIALPPLGLLRALGTGDRAAIEASAARAVSAMSDSLRAELPQMLTEHGRIRSAVIRLEEAATRQSDSGARALAVRLQLHAQHEEDVMYPAAVLVGEMLRVRGWTGAGGEGSLPTRR